MTPIKDHAYRDRQWIIHGPDAPIQMYKNLIKQGYTPYAAEQLSGYRQMDAFDRHFKLLTRLVIVAAAIALFAAWNIAGAAVMELPGYQQTESALIHCLNGGTIKLDSGEEFICWRSK